MSTTIASVMVTLLAMILPYFGISVGSDQLTQAVQTVIVVIAGVWIWFRRYQIGDVTVAGLKK